MDSGTLHISTPGLLDALCDAEAMEVWELLRASSAGCSASELAGESGIPLARALAILERLERVALVERRPAGRGRRTPTFRVAVPELRIGYDGIEPEAMLAMFARWNQAQIARFERMLAHRSKRPGGYFCGVGWARLDAEERAQLRMLVDQISALMRNTGRRSRENQAVQGGGHRNYAMLLRLEDLDREPLPYPNVKFVRATEDATPAPARAERPALSPRELQVAEALASGMTRPEIARQLGLSLHTVVTVSGRVYRKLGVHSRAELVRVMKG